MVIFYITIENIHFELIILKVLPSDEGICRAQGEGDWGYCYFHRAIKTMAFGTCEYLMEITLPPFYIKSISLFLQLALTLHFKHSLGIWYFIVPGLIHLRKISRFCDLVVGHFALMWILIMSDLKMVWDQNGLVSKPSKIPNFTVRGA